MLRNKIKKEGLKPKVGDKVEIESLNHENNTAAISVVLPRRNEIHKPNIANIDQVIIVMSSYSPDFNPLVLDKLIVLSESNNITPVICINKSDKMDDDLKNYINNTYKDTEYKIIYTSSFNGMGIDEIRAILNDKVSVLTGVSGAGKSSIINAIDPKLKLQIKEVSKQLGTGRHTTRHVSLQTIYYQGHIGFLADTPGFSFIEFDNIASDELAWYFKEFTDYIPECPFSGCLHWKEPNCNVKQNIDVNSSRYANYLAILLDIMELEKVQKKRSSKIETQVKVTQRADGKNIRVVKLGSQSKELSRRVSKQFLNNIKYSHDIEDNNF